MTEKLTKISAQTTPNFQALKVLSLESRMALPMQKLIEKYHGTAQLAASVREVPLEDNEQAFHFFEQLKAGQFDVMILMTGVGLRTLLKIWETRYSLEEIQDAFKQTQVLVRGPKPTSVCKMQGIEINITAPPPNTWQEILQILSEQNLLNQKQIALLEYGSSDPSFIENLEARGVKVVPLQVYKWALPQDTAPLRQAFEDVIAGKVDVFLLTSAIQIDHFLKMSQSVEEELQFRRALHRVVVVSIGPTCTARLRERQIFPDLEVFPNKMDNLVAQAAEQSHSLLEKKRQRAENSWVRLQVPLDLEKKADAVSQWEDSLMMRACRRLPNPRPPLWLMRQAGRYMAEYQLIRQGRGFIEFCKNPDLCTQATLDAIERLGVDAAIIFADILLILEPMGADLNFYEGVGPVIKNPVRSVEAIDSLKPVDPESDLHFTLQAIRQVRQNMSARIPLIGFSGAPFTLASYLVEGRSSRNYLAVKTLMLSEPQAWHRLMEKFTTAIVTYLHAQVAAGCQILQIFDSWVGALSPAQYQEFVFPHMKRLFSELPQGVPSIHFGTGTAALLDLMKQAGGDVIALDAHVDIAASWQRLGEEVAVQGNLDSSVLFAPISVIERETQKILQAVGNKPGFIFNLGHGILPETPVDHVMSLVDCVKSFKFSKY
ncbi:MAG: uroporphyrinogen decarboxylase [Deltaproteobacteria bacterium]|nr:uroporphyrinogen decarboxylase [Deltaproteobacteria bacterium]